VNLDGKPDSWDVNLVFPLSTSDAPIVSFTLLLFFQVNLKGLLNAEMNGLVQLDSASNGAAGNKWIVAGDLTFVQRNPLSRTSAHGTRNTYRYPVVNDSTLLSIEDTDLGTILLANHARNGTGHARLGAIGHTLVHDISFTSLTRPRCVATAAVLSLFFRAVCLSPSVLQRRCQPRRTVYGRNLLLLRST
jgi:hypothetical protein